MAVELSAGAMADRELRLQMLGPLAIERDGAAGAAGLAQSLRPARLSRARAATDPAQPTVRTAVGRGG